MLLQIFHNINKKSIHQIYDITWFMQSSSRKSRKNPDCDVHIAHQQHCKVNKTCIHFQAYFKLWKNKF